MIKDTVRQFLSQYMVLIAIGATVLAVLYFSRKKVLGTFTETFTGRTLDEYKADVQTIKETSVSSLASDIWATIKVSLPGGYISAEEYQAWKEEQQALRSQG